MDSDNGRPQSIGPPVGDEEEGERAWVWEFLVNLLPALKAYLRSLRVVLEELEDVLHDTLVRVMERLKKPHDTLTYESLRQLAFAHGKYAVHALVRKRRKEPDAVAFDDEVDGPPLDELTVDDPQTQLENDELLGIATRSFAGLAHQQKRAVQLDLEDKEDKEIAEEMHVSTNTAKTHKKRGYETLREDVREGGWDPPTKGGNSKSKRKPTKPGEDND